MTSSQEYAVQTRTGNFWMYDRLNGFLRACSALAPRVLIIDDIHKADEASIEFLSFIAPDVASQKLLLVMTLQGDADEDNCSAHLLHLLRYADQIQLSRLSQEDVGKIVYESGLIELNDNSVRTFYDKTGGNPLFVYETYKLLVSTCLNCDKQLEETDLHGLAVPTVIKNSLQRQLDTLDQLTRSILDMASVIGRSFNLLLLAKIFDQENRILIAALDKAVNTGLVVKESSIDFRFGHDYICRVTYEILPSATRADYHNRIAEALLNNPESQSHMAEVAFHLNQACLLLDIN